MNEKYGTTEPYHHDFNGAGVCKKCHKPVAKLKLKVCAVIGLEEVAQFRDVES
jgi:hypothetical protein